MLAFEEFPEDELLCPGCNQSHCRCEDETDHCEYCGVVTDDMDAHCITPEHYEAIIADLKGQIKNLRDCARYDNDIYHQQRKTIAELRAQLEERAAA